MNSTFLKGNVRCRFCERSMLCEPTWKAKGLCFKSSLSESRFSASRACTQFATLSFSLWEHELAAEAAMDACSISLVGDGAAYLLGRRYKSNLASRSFCTATLRDFSSCNFNFKTADSLQFLLWLALGKRSPLEQTLDLLQQKVRSLQVGSSCHNLLLGLLNLARVITLYRGRRSVG